MNNYCVFEDKSVGKIDPCDCDKYCPTKECIEFISTHKSDGKKINIKEIDEVIAKNSVIELENKITEKKAKLKGMSGILKNDQNKAKIFAKNLLDNSNRSEKFEFLKEKKIGKIKDYEKFLKILSNKKDLYQELNDEIFEDDIQTIKDLFLKKLDNIKHNSELVQVDDTDFQENKKNLVGRFDDFVHDKKELIEIIKKMDGEINTNNDIVEKRKNDIKKLNEMLKEDEKELKVNTDKVNEKCNKQEKKCPDHLKKVLVLLLLFMVILYYSLYKINY